MAVSASNFLPRVAVGRHLSSESINVDNYRSWVGDELVDEIHELSKDLKDLRICNVNATASGGGVAELLSRMIPAYLALGITTDWRLIYGDKDFFTITKSFHNALQGAELRLTPDAKHAYLDRNKASAEMLPDEYDAAVFTMKAFQPADLDLKHVVFIPPAIDPVSPKNMELPSEVYQRAIGEMGIDLHRPLLLQVSRFDPWKDPLGVIRAYQIAKEKVPGIQLAMVGAMAGDDPQGWDILEKINQEAVNDPDLF